jgi:hypothetical protein
MCSAGMDVFKKIFANGTAEYLRKYSSMRTIKDAQPASQSTPRISVDPWPRDRQW